MKKILILITALILLALAGFSQVQVSQPYSFLQWIKVKDSIRGAIFLQNGDTLATQAYARGFAGAGTGYGIKKVSGNLTLDTAVARKVDTVYSVNDSTIGFNVNGHAYQFLIRGRYSPGTPCTGCLLAANNFSDIANTSTARANLGLGTSATKDAPSSGNASLTQVVMGNDTRLIGFSPPGSDRELIFNDGGNYGADGNFTFSKAFRESCLGCNVSFGDAHFDGGGAVNGGLFIGAQNGPIWMTGDTATVRSTAGSTSIVRFITNNLERFKMDNSGNISLPTLTSNSDSSAWKPMVFNPSTKAATYLDHWPIGGSGGFTNPMTAAGDIIYGGSGGSGLRLPAGTSHQVLHSGSTPNWSAVNLLNDVTGSLPDGNIASASTWNAKQDPLISGTNLKTINGNSLLGSGDLPIAGGGGPDSTYFKLGYTDVSAYGGHPDGLRFADGAILITSHNFTSAHATFTSADIGKSIAIGGAGAGGSMLVTTIATFVSSSSVTLTAAAGATVSGANFEYGTDNTAPIQNATNAACTNPSATVYFPADHTGRFGTYLMFGAPVTNVGGYNPNAQWYVPLSAYAPSDSQTVVRFIGEVPPNLFIDFAPGQGPPNSGIVIESMRNDSGAAVLGTVAQSAIYGTFNWRMVYLENLQIRTKSDNLVTDVKPMMSGINFLNQNFVSIKNVRISTSSATGNSIKPDTAAVGIYLPGINNGGNNQVNNLLVQGFHRGVVVNENTHLDNLTVAACWRALEFDSSYHTTYIGRALVVWCPYKIFCPSSQAYFDIAQLDLEHYDHSGPVWFRDSLDLDAVRATSTSAKINYFIQLAYGGEQMRGFTRNDNHLTSGISVMPIGMGWSYQPLGGVNEEYSIGQNIYDNAKNYVFQTGTNKALSIDLARKGIKKFSIGMGLQNVADNDLYMYNQSTGRVSYYDSASQKIGIGGAQAHLTPALLINNSDNSSTILGNAYISGTKVAIGNSSALNFTHNVEIGTDGSGHPMETMHYAAGSLNQKNWYRYALDGQLHYASLNDGGSSPADWLQVNNSGGIPTAVLFPNGNVGIGVSSPSNALEVAGSILSTNVKLGSSITFSKPIEFGLEAGHSAMAMTDPAGAADEKLTDFFFSAHTFNFGRAINDALSVTNTLMLATRSGASWTSTAFPTGNFGIGTSTPNTSALLDLTSTTQGALLPRMTTTQRNAISSPATGLEIFNTTTVQFEFYNGSAWVAVGGSSAPFSDASALVSNSSDPTKLLKFSAAGITTGTTRTVTFPDANITVARTDAGQTYTGVQNYTSSPTVPDISDGDSSGKAAPTEWVKRQIAALTNSLDVITTKDITTTNATTVNVDTIPISPGENVHIEVIMNAVKDNGHASVESKKVISFLLDDASSLHAGTSHVIESEEYLGSGLSTANFVIIGSGSLIILQFTGEASTNILARFTETITRKGAPL